MFDRLKQLKEKAGNVAGAHGDKNADGLAKAGGVIDDKTGGKYSDKIDATVDKAQDYVEKLGDKKD